MADIFLSYAREDLNKARLLAEALERHGWSVWWDRSKILPGQNIDKIIKQAIAEAKCLIVIWSPAANASLWVTGEANIGLRRNMLVQIHIGEFDPPINFQAIHSEDFSSWNGELDHPEFTKLKTAVKQLATKSTISTPTEAEPFTIELYSGTAELSGKVAKLPFEPEMIEIPAGSFQMGGDQYDDEMPIHNVTILKPFKLSRYPVTFAEYDEFAKQTGRNKPDDQGWGRERRPVINVSWQDAVDYTAWLREKTGKAYRLPSEAEWEYACRAGSTSQFFWGDDDSPAKDHAWFADNTGRRTEPVGQKQANPYGLYNMTGNVWEWLQDSWHDNYQGAPDNGLAWETGGDSAQRVLRGGSWDDGANYLRSANRRRGAVDDRYDDIGFRLAQD